MTVTVASFRGAFTEFADANRFPETSINYWLTLAASMLNAQRFGSLLDLGTALFIAHNVTLERKAQDEAAVGAPPGFTTGPVNNKSVDKASLGYDVQAGIDDGAGHWNLTIYGTRLIRLMKMMGAGPIQVGAGSGCLDPFSSANAWPGPWQSQFPNQS